MSLRLLSTIVASLALAVFASAYGDARAAMLSPALQAAVGHSARLDPRQIGDPCGETRCILGTDCCRSEYPPICADNCCPNSGGLGCGFLEMCQYSSQGGALLGCCGGFGKCDENDFPSSCISFSSSQCSSPTNATALLPNAPDTCCGSRTPHCITISSRPVCAAETLSKPIEPHRETASASSTTSTTALATTTTASGSSGSSRSSAETSMSSGAGTGGTTTPSSTATSSGTGTATGAGLTTTTTTAGAAARPTVFGGVGAVVVGCLCVQGWF